MSNEDGRFALFPSKRTPELYVLSDRRAGSTQVTDVELLQLYQVLGNHFEKKDEHTGATLEACRHCGTQWICPECDGLEAKEETR